MGFFGNIWKTVKSNFGPMKRGIRRTIGEKSDILGALTSQIPIIGQHIAPIVKTAARDWGQGKSFKRTMFDIGKNVAKNYGVPIPDFVNQLGLNIVDDKPNVQKVSLKDNRNIEIIKKRLQQQQGQI